MSRFIFNMPDIGEGIAEAEIVQWHKQVGDTVNEDEEFVDMMTDKATVSMESPVTGKILEVAGGEGDMVSIGSMLVVIEVEGEIPEDVAIDESEVAAPATPSSMSGDEKIEERVEADSPDSLDAEDVMRPAPTSPSALAPTLASVPAQEASKTVLATPAVRKRARDLGIDLAQIKPAEDGRVRHSDLDQFLSYNSGYGAATKPREDEERKVIGMRRRIAENMAASKRNIPHFSYVEECDVTALEELRAQLNANRGDKPKLTILPMLITAICKTLPDFPMINARYDDEAGVVTRHGTVHIGMATQTDAGLMVPVIRNAHAKNLWQLANEITRLAESARNGSAKSEDLQGGTLTVTSLGPLGGVATTPVINRPEVAIIGPNRIVERPMYITGSDGTERIEKRKLMNISISCDHRVVDGWDAASYVRALKNLLEAPSLILIGS